MDAAALTPISDLQALHLIKLGAGGLKSVHSLPQRPVSQGPALLKCHDKAGRLQIFFFNKQ